MKLTDFLPYVLPEVPGCPQITATRAIRDAVIEFCTKSDVYMAEPQSLVLIPNVTEYDIDVPAGAEVNHVTKLLRQGRPLDKLPYFDAIEKLDGAQAGSTPSYYAQSDNNTLIVGPVPSEREKLTLLFTLKPTAKASSIPDTIGLEHRDTIVSGALFRLQMMAGSAWANGGAATSNKALFDRGINAALRQAKYGHGGAPLTVYSREFI